MKNENWYTFVRFGSDPMPARGPFKSVEEADEAMEAFRFRYGHLAASYLASGSVRMVGPFPSRAKARNADISTARSVRA